MNTFEPPTLAPVAEIPQLAEPVRRTFTFESDNSFSLDLNWAEENSFGEMRGLGAFRVDGARPVRLRWTVETDTITTVRSSGESSVNLAVFAAAGSTPRISVRALLNAPDEADPLLRAMLGDHPLHWMHSLLHGVGSPAWAIFAMQARVWPPRLDRILNHWRDLATGAESALWRCAGDESGLSALLDWANRLVEGMPAGDVDAAVRVSLAADPQWASSPEAEWLEACGGVPLSMLGTQAATDRLRAGGELAVRLVKSGLNARLLDSLREMAAECLGQARLSQAMVATLQQKQLHRSELTRLCGAIYSEAQPALAAAAAGWLGLLIEARGADWPLAEASFDLSEPGGDSAFQAAMASGLPPFPAAERGVRHEPGLLPLCAARPLCLQVSLPPLPQRRAKRVLATLSEAEVSATPGNRIEVRPPAGRHARPEISDDSLVRRLALAPLRLTAREPGDGGLEFACEDFFHPAEGTPTILWRRLLDRYGFPLPASGAAARLRISIPTAWTEIWRELPHSRDETFSRVFSSIAVTIQAAMRRWMPHLALKDVGHYADPLTALPLLAYAASQPFVGSGKGGFTHDRLTAPGFQLAFNSAGEEFPEIVREVQEDLLAMSHRSYRSYDPGRALTLFSTVFRQRRYFSSLLAADALLVEEVLHLADSAAELHSTAVSPRFSTRLLFKSIDSAESGLYRRFQGVYDGRSFDRLLSVVWVEATASACRAMGAKAEVNAVLTLEHADGCEYFHNAAALGLL